MQADGKEKNKPTVIGRVPLGSIFVWSSEMWLLTLVYMGVVLALMSVLGNKSSLDTVTSIVLFVASTLNVILHLAIAIGVGRRDHLTAASNNILQRTLHIQISNAICSLAYLVCWNYIWLYFDTCIASSASSTSLNGSSGDSNTNSKYVQVAEAMCNKALFQGYEGILFIWPSVLAGVSAGLNFVVFFASLALAFTCSSGTVFSSKTCLYASGIVFALSFSMIKYRAFHVCDNDRVQMEFWSGSFLGFSITGMLVACVDDIFSHKYFEQILLDARLGIKCVWCLMCLVSIFVVGLVHPNHRGMMGFGSGLFFTIVLFVWSLVDLGLLIQKKIQSPQDSLKFFQAKKYDMLTTQDVNEKRAMSQDNSHDSHMKQSNLSSNAYSSNQSPSWIFASDDVRASLRSRYCAAAAVSSLSEENE